MEISCIIIENESLAAEKLTVFEKNLIKIANQLLPISDTYKDHFYDILRKSRNLI